MLVYITIFTCAIILTVIADISSRKSRLFTYWICFATVLLVSAFSGLRDSSVGYDFHFYCAGHLRAARSLGFANFIGYVGGGEWAYALIIYLVGLASGSYNFLMFILSFVTSFMAMLAAINLRDRVPICISFSIFLFFILVPSYNLIRQSLAVSGVWLAFSIYKGKNGGLMYWLMSLICFGFHKSSILAIIVVWVSHRFSFAPQQTRRKVIVLGMFASFALFAALQAIMLYLSNIFPIFDKYLMYVDGTGNNASWARPELNKSYLLFSFIATIAIVKAKKADLLDNKKIFIFTFVVICFTLGTALGRYTSTATRICLYFLPLVFIAIAEIVKSKVNLFKQPQFLGYVIIVILAAFFCLNNIRHDPDLCYKSEILGIKN